MVSMKIIFSGRINGTEYKNAKATIYKGTPLSDPPKSYTKVGLVSHSITDLLSNRNLYNPSTATIYQNKSGKLFYEIYRDGCFYPYYGKLEIERD